jgi:hypothetical protein
MSIEPDWQRGRTVIIRSISACPAEVERDDRPRAPRLHMREVGGHLVRGLAWLQRQRSRDVELAGNLEVNPCDGTSMS